MGLYLVWCEELGQKQNDGKQFAEAGPREAAQEWARWQDWHSAEFSIVGGREVDVHVEHLDNGNRTRWRVTGKSVPEYSAKVI